MAINAGTVWEVRTAGGQTNGGGFYNRVPGTSVDYSQQDAPVLARTNIATDGAGTTLTTVTGGFTAAMVGNIIFLTGGGVTEGWYEIVAYTDANTVTIDRSAGADKTGVTGNVGGAFAIGGSRDDDFFESAVAGNTIYIGFGGGSYALGESISIAAAGTVTSPINIIGYKTSRGDTPTGDNRPLLNVGSTYVFTPGPYFIIKHLRFTGARTGGSAIVGCNTHIYFNCKVTNTSTGHAIAWSVSGYNPRFINVEASGGNNAIATGARLCSVSACYLHDSTNGVDIGSSTAVINSVIDTCSGTGILCGAATRQTILGNTIYNCGTGISGTTSDNATIVNNIIANCTTGASWGTATPTNFWDYNCFYNPDPGANRVNVAAGPHDVDADPKLKNPAAGDFTLDTNSPCFDTGMKLGALVGLT